jgi:hypothetical protein
MNAVDQELARPAQPMPQTAAANNAAEPSPDSAAGSANTSQGVQSAAGSQRRQTAANLSKN